MRIRYLMMAVVCVAILGIDRWLKSLALSGFTAQSPFGQFVLFKNYGIIFSWPVPNIVATILMVGALVVVVCLLIQANRRHDLLKLLAVSLMLVGAVSNIYDRLVHGFIIDWAYLGSWWPVFNLADVYIMVGLVVFLIRSRPTTLS